MTNNEIISQAKAAAGIPEEVDIHTFAGWKEIGYRVKKGQHAALKIPIWKVSAKKGEIVDSEEAHSRMFIKVAFFFLPSQVEEET